MPNKLIHESSPYLQQHANNPVDWYPWGDEALERARNEKKLIFLSIGYSSCHWCHVMEHESFEDEQTANYLNENYISIKVDREERPDIDAVYMEAVQIMGQQGGWPLNVWLTPDLDPVFGGTYFPLRSMHGRPSFLDVLNRLQQLYDPENPEIKDRIAQIRSALGQDLYSHAEASPLSDSMFDSAAKVLAGNYDRIDGGFSPAPKFPMAMCIGFLIKLGAARPDRERTDMALNSLRKMIAGGIYDQIGGGFHRYSTDTRWLVPHFEKMLYDQALLISALSDAGSASGDPIFRETIRETIGFLNRELRDPSGAYYSALDADTEGEEGRFYVWKWDELAGILDPDELRYTAAFLGASREGNWEGSNILIRSDSGRQQQNRELEATIKAKLLNERDNRVRPGLDDKVITSWNAMLLKSLCKAARAFNSCEWRGYALVLADFLRSELIKNERVMRIWKNGESGQPGFLDDHALLAEAFTYVFELTGDETWLELSVGLCNSILESFFDPEKQAFFYTAGYHDTLPVRSRNIFDNAEPSGTSATIAAIWRTGMLAGNSHFVDTATKAAERLAGISSKHATAFGYLLDISVGIWYHQDEIIITGIDGNGKTGLGGAKPKGKTDSVPVNNTAADIPVHKPDSTTHSKRTSTGSPKQTGTPSDGYIHKIRETIAGRYRPFSLIVEGDTFEFSNFSTLRGKKPLGNKPAIYQCKDFTCRKPVHDPAEID